VIDHGRFFVPGPTEVRPDVLDAMRRPMIFHRTPEMEALMRRVTAGLGEIFGTRRAVHILGGSGTSAMELAIRNGSIGNVLAVVNGDFGERFAKLAESCGRKVTRLTATPGDAVPVDRIREALEGGRFDAVTLTQNETATGVLVDVGAIAKVVRNVSDAFVLVDAVSSAGGVPIAMDEWGVDAVVSASQKAMGLPPGLAFAAVSSRLVERARTLPDRGTYLDVLRYEEFVPKSQSPTTPPVSLLFALDAQVAFIQRETLPARYRRHREMMEHCTEWFIRAQKTGLPVSLVAKAGLFSATVTCVRTSGPNSVVLDGMRARGYELGGGQAELLKTSFRVGHMGDHTVGGLEAMLAALGDLLRESAGKVA
jgi:aspartate aminotransferase-like enzyme